MLGCVVEVIVDGTSVLKKATDNRLLEELEKEA